MPASIAARHVQSLALAGANSPASMPVAPAIRPIEAISRVAANPIKMPPVADRPGVKAVSMEPQLWQVLAPTKR